MRLSDGSNDHPNDASHFINTVHLHGGHLVRSPHGAVLRRRPSGRRNQLYCQKYQSETVKELTQWPNASDLLKQIDSKTKAALTRTYNKLNIKRSYAIQGKEKPKKKGKAAAEGDENEDSENEQR